MRKLTFVFIIAIMTSGGVMAQEIIFPASSGFRVEQNYPVYSPGELWDYINGAAESYLSFGFRELYIAEYKRGKKVNIKAEIYCHTDPVMAFGIYSMERAPSYNFMDIGVQGYSEEGLIHFLKGSYYVKVMTHSKSKKATGYLKNIALLIEQSLEGTTEMPELLKLFPEDGRLANEEMYISENVLGHQFLNNAFRANYETNGRRFVIYLFNRGDEIENREMLGRYLGKAGLDPGDSADGKFFFRDGYNGEIFLAWKSNITVLVTGLTEEDAPMANSYIEKILR